MHEGTRRRHPSTFSIADSPTILAGRLAKRSVERDEGETKRDREYSVSSYSWRGSVLIESPTSRRPSASLSNLSVLSAHPVYSGYGGTAGVKFVDVSAPWSQVCSRERGGYVCACVGHNSVPHGERGSRSMPRNRGTLESRAHQQASACSAVPIRSGRRVLSFANLHAYTPMFQGAFNPLLVDREKRERERGREGGRGEIYIYIYIYSCMSHRGCLTSVVSRVSLVRFITRYFHDQFSQESYRNALSVLVELMDAISESAEERRGDASLDRNVSPRVFW